MFVSCIRWLFVSQLRGIIITSHLTDLFGLPALNCFHRPARLVWLLLIIQHKPPPTALSCTFMFVSKRHKGTFFEGEGDERWLLTGPPAPWLWGPFMGQGWAMCLLQHTGQGQNSGCLRVSHYISKYGKCNEMLPETWVLLLQSTGTNAKQNKASSQGEGVGTHSTSNGAWFLPALPPGNFKVGIAQAGEGSIDGNNFSRSGEPLFSPMMAAPTSCGKNWSYTGPLSNRALTLAVRIPLLNTGRLFSLGFILPVAKGLSTCRGTC